MLSSEAVNLVLTMTQVFIGGYALMCVLVLFMMLEVVRLREIVEAFTTKATDCDV